jgi:hypothetical protein
MEIMRRRLLTFLIIIAVVLFSGCAEDLDSTGGIDIGMHPLGVWWWYSELIRDRRYLDFAAQNKVDEIYLCTEDFSEEIKNFIEAAHGYNIRVYLLAGDYRYIEDDRPLQDLFALYQEYQYGVSESYRFSGIHLDIEPHQHPRFNEQRGELLAGFLSLMVKLQAQQPIEIDIPFWFDDMVSYGGEEKPLYQALIDTASRVFVMSYRDTAEMMYDVAREEIRYAASVNKPIMLGAELYSLEGDQVSYAEEGKIYLYEQLDLLKAMVNYSRAGVAIHHIDTWYNLHD